MPTRQLFSEEQETRVHSRRRIYVPIVELLTIFGENIFETLAHRLNRAVFLSIDSF